MNVDAGAADVRHSQANFGEYVNIQDSGYTRQDLLWRKEPTGWDGIEKTFSERGLKQAHPVKQGAS